jgi:hypothetical protein
MIKDFKISSLKPVFANMRLEFNELIVDSRIVVTALVTGLFLNDQEMAFALKTFSIITTGL